MLTSLEKHGPLISIVLLVFLLASLLLWPEAQGGLSLVIIIISVGMLLAFTVHRRLEENHKGLIDRPTMTRLIILDCAGILLVLVSAMYVGSLVSKVVGEKVYDGMQESAPQWAEGVAITSSLLAALVAGVGVGWLVRSIFGKLERTQISKLS
jgi:hypothetical protein